MPATLADSLNVLLPYLSPELTAPEVIPHLQEVAHILAPIPRGGFECRLGANAPQVDLQQCIVRSHDQFAEMATHIENATSSAEAPVHPAWDRIGALCTLWGDSSSPLHNGISEIWLEFDADHSLSHILIPSLFFGLERDTLTPYEAHSVVEMALGVLFEGSPPLSQQRHLRRCFEACEDGAQVSHIGVMLARQSGALRVNIKRLRPDEILPYLERVSWPGPADELEILVAELFNLVDGMTVCLDVGTRVYPKIGLECFFDQQPEREPRWATFFDDLVKRGLCTPDKRGALLAWPGFTDPMSSSTPWPADLITQSLLKEPDQFSVFDRRLHHIKIVSQPQQPLEAKAYLWFGHAWMRSRPERSHHDESIFVLTQRRLTFPTDHGAHPQYPIEWWHYIGNLETATGHHFGCQLTFFREIVVSSARRQTPASIQSSEQIYKCHFALTDVVGKRYHSFERIARGSAPLAGVQVAPYQIWLGDWQVEEVEPDVYRLRARHENSAIDLLLTDTKGPVLHGDRGYYQKGSRPDGGSHYYSLTRFASEGTLRIGETLYKVSGLSWMDHEFTTHLVPPDLSGWDWFSIHLDDGTDLMLYRLRRQDGSQDASSSGVLIAADGSRHDLNQNDYTIIVDETWRSPHSKVDYPARWIITVHPADLTLELDPYLADQEMNASLVYWEGAVQVKGTHAGQPVYGSGYAELTGYAEQPMEKTL